MEWIIVAKNGREIAISLYNAYLIYKQVENVYNICQVGITGVSAIYKVCTSSSSQGRIELTEEEIKELEESYVIVEKESPT